MATISRLSKARFEDNAGIRSRRIGLITMGTYATGGESVTPQKFKLGTLEMVHFEMCTNATPIGITLKYDYTNSKVLAFAADGTQVADTTDLSAYTARFEAIGY